MKAIILAAGVGKRLGEHSEERPKCLLKIDDKTLLQRMLGSLIRLKVSPIILVVGYQNKLIQNFVKETFPNEDIRFIVNPDYEQGSIVSLWTAREEMDDDFLLMDADVLYHDEILHRLCNTKHSNCFLLDRNFKDDGEAYVAAAKDGKIVGFERGVKMDHDLMGESVGFFRLSKELSPHLKKAIQKYLKAKQLDAHYEFAISDLLTSHQFGYEDVTGLPWTEIDFLEDAKHAQEEVLPFIESNLPSRQYTLLNPGPANTTATVRSSITRLPDLCHREEEFFETMQQVRLDLLKIAGANPENYSTVAFTGSGTAAVEATIASVVPDHGKILVIDNGVYGDRMKRMAEAHHIPYRLLKYPWTTLPHLPDIDRILAEDSAVTHVAVAHHETTTGLLNPIHEIGQIVKSYGCSLIVDAMSSFAGEKLNVEESDIDFTIFSSNKCLQALPGLSFVIARRECLLELEDYSPRSVYLDLFNQWKQEEANNTPFTPAIQMFFALKKAIEELFEETLEGRINRYAACAQVLRKKMTELGFQILVPEKSRSNLLTTFLLPKGLDYDPLHDQMKKRGYIIYAGQGDIKKTAFRIANMGTLAPNDMNDITVAIKNSIRELGITRIEYDSEREDQN